MAIRLSLTNPNPYPPDGTPRHCPILRPSGLLCHARCCGRCVPLLDLLQQVIMSDNTQRIAGMRPSIFVTLLTALVVCFATYRDSFRSEPEPTFCGYTEADIQQLLVENPSMTRGEILEMIQFTDGLPPVTLTR